MKHIEHKFSHAAIFVSNMERSIDFYERALGWVQSFSVNMDSSLGVANRVGGPGRICRGELAGVPLQLVEMEKPLARKEDPIHYGIFMFSLIFSDLEPVRAHLKAEGFTISREQQLPGSLVLTLTDPDGQEIALIQAPPAPPK